MASSSPPLTTTVASSSWRQNENSNIFWLPWKARTSPPLSVTGSVTSWPLQRTGFAALRFVRVQASSFQESSACLRETALSGILMCDCSPLLHKEGIDK